MPPSAYPERVLSEPARALTVAARRSEPWTFARSATVFVAIGLLLYAGAYAVSEWLVYRHAQTNKFFLLSTAPRVRYDYVILGASHAAALGYQDMTERLEAMTGKSILNLAVVGGGVQVNRLMFDCFLKRHQASAIVYVVDSFGFYSTQWNEDRLQDRRLFLRAPLDRVLAARLLSAPTTRVVGIDYVTGFSKINNQGRLGPDVSADESSRFTRTYRPVRQLDDQRMEYLYPGQVDQTAFERYLQDFQVLLRDAQSRDVEVIVVKPPLPERIAARLPNESQFDERLRTAIAPLGLTLHDFTHSNNDDGMFFDTDHLNRQGVLAFFEQALVPLLGSR